MFSDSDSDSIDAYFKVILPIAVLLDNYPTPRAPSHYLRWVSWLQGDVRKVSPYNSTHGRLIHGYMKLMGVHFISSPGFIYWITWYWVDSSVLGTISNFRVYSGETGRTWSPVWLGFRVSYCGYDGELLLTREKYRRPDMVLSKV